MSLGEKLKLTIKINIILNCEEQVVLNENLMIFDYVMCVGSDIIETYKK